MKAYRIEGQYSQAVFYVGYRKDVQPTLNAFFAKYQDGVTSSKQDLQHSAKPILVNLSPNFSQTLESKSLPSDSSQTSIKHLSLHVLLYDLALIEYNHFRQDLLQKFSDQISRYPDPMVLRLAMVESREESLRYIQKIQKYTKPDFEQNLLQLDRELHENAEYDLVKTYLAEKFNISREQVFAWMHQTNVSNFKELLSYRDVPGYQKKDLRKLLSNLTLLESLHNGTENKKLNSIQASTQSKS